MIKPVIIFLILFILTTEASTSKVDKNNAYKTRESPPITSTESESENWDLIFENVTMHDNSDITLYISPSNQEKCLKKSKSMKIYCGTSGTIPTKESFDMQYAERFPCSKTFYNITSISFSSMYLYCTVKEDFKYDVIKYKYIDYFRELTGVPHWVIWAAIALQSLLIVGSCICYGFVNKP